MELFAGFYYQLKNYHNSEWLAVAALALVAVWFFTGRLRAIGWIVRLLWLQINALAVPFWWFFALLGWFYVRFWKLFWIVGLWFLLMGLIFHFPEFYIGVMCVFLLWLGTINRYHIRKLITFYPKPLRNPPPSIPRPKGNGGGSVSKPPTERQATKEQTLIVKIHAPQRSGHYDEATIIQKLPPHLQNLLAGRFERR